MSDKKERDIPENVRLVSLQFILTGGGLLGLGLLEKKNHEKKQISRIYWL